jgi:hypothetical protein
MRARVLVSCDCKPSKRFVLTRYFLIRKDNPRTHCGCQNRQITSHKQKVEYNTWQGMIARCYNENHNSYADYGGRGVTVTPAWLGSGWDPKVRKASFDGFLQFYKDLGPRPQGCTLDRKEANGHYELGNCRWLSVKEQNRNKRGTKWILHPKTGEPIKAAVYAEELGVPYQQMRKHLVETGVWHVKVSPPSK